MCVGRGGGERKSEDGIRMVENGMRNSHPIEKERERERKGKGEVEGERARARGWGREGKKKKS